MRLFGKNRFMHEKILCVKRELMPASFVHKRSIFKLSYEDLVSVLIKADYTFTDRNMAECDRSCKQIIPYILVINSEQHFLVYRRDGKEKRLHGFWSAGVGGHINMEDSAEDLSTLIMNGAVRELKEETGLGNIRSIIFLGIINEEETSVGIHHIGLVFVYTMAEDETVSLSHELSDGRFIDIRNRGGFNFELWSTMAIELL